MSTYKEFADKVLFENGFLSEKDFDQVIASFPGLEFDLNKINIFEGCTYDKSLVAEEIVYSKLFDEGLDTDEIALVNWSVDVDSKEMYLDYEVSEAYKVPIDKIKSYFPEYTVEINIEEV